jgi:hypothetical protein
MFVTPGRPKAFPDHISWAVVPSSLLSYKDVILAGLEEEFASAVFDITHASTLNWKLCVLANLVLSAHRHHLRDLTPDIDETCSQH